MSMKSTRVRRDDVDAKEGKIIHGIQEADFISLVKRPANQRAISVIRSQTEEEDVANTSAKPTTAKRITRTKRSDASTIAKVTFPATYTDEAVTETLTSYGLSSFTVTRSDESVVAEAANLQSIASDTLSDIKLTEDGIVASVVRAEGANATEGKKELALVSFEFSSETFSRADAKSWLTENSIDFDEKALDNSTGNFVLQRSDVAEGEEIRQLELEPGVVANVARSDVMLVPDGFVTVISEAAYGGWGWGMLDFEALLANVNVSEKLREGLCYLEDVLRNILFYSDLPVDARKELAQRSLTQFGSYASSLLDTLPRQLLIQVGSAQRNDKAQEPVNMTDAAKKDTDVLTITRGDLKALVADVIREAKDTPAVAAAPAAEPAPVAAAPAATAITREDIADLFKAAVAPLDARLEKIESTAVVRSDSGDQTSAAQAQAAADANLTPEERKIKREDVFGNINLGFGVSQPK